VIEIVASVAGGNVMSKQSLLGVTAFCLVFALAAYAGVEVYTSNPRVQRVSNEYFTAELEPQLKPGQNFFATFRFVLTNKTKKELQIDWENTYYLLNDLRNGRFLWEGVTWDGLKKIRSKPLIPVAPGDTFTSVIFPKNLVGRGSAMSKGGVQYTQGALPEGENSILLFVRQNGRVVREKMVVSIRTN
jgi:hypothetical protein